MSYELSMQDLELAHAELLPAREALGGFNKADVYANNITAAVNWHSPCANATGVGVQYVHVNQH